jgi:hypothetical protein
MKPFGARMIGIVSPLHPQDAKPSCKAVIYKSPDARGSWGSHGTDASYLGPSVEHYRCNHYFIPKTQEYRISRSAELFPQHCQVPFLSTKDHLQELTNEVVSMLKNMTAEKQRRVLTLFWAKIADKTIHLHMICGKFGTHFHLQMSLILALICK